MLSKLCLLSSHEACFGYVYVHEQVHVEITPSPTHSISRRAKNEKDAMTLPPLFVTRLVVVQNQSFCPV
jgi:hypothetical protein